MSIERGQIYFVNLNPVQGQTESAGYSAAVGVVVSDAA
jgi:mRNA-degrading endonuclease toxin of MazEF toxin-antitoxin module